MKADRPGQAGGPPKKNWTDEVKRSAELFSLYADAYSDERLEMVAAYKWSNPARPRVAGDRLCLLYVHEGRPVASCKVYPTGRSIVHAWISFTDLPLAARRGDALVWSPPPSGVEFTTVPDAAPPHSTAGRRRIQMKALAREFTAETGPGEAARQSTVPQLRLLPKPLYRYSMMDGGQDGLVDGAVFCFVANGGNPQVFLLIEAIREGGSTYWRYGFSRRTNARLTTFHKKKEVWSVRFVPARAMNSRGSFFKLDLPALERGPSGAEL